MRSLLLVAALSFYSSTSSAETARPWQIGFGLALSHESMQTDTRDGGLSVAGPGMELRLSLSRQTGVKRLEWVATLATRAASQLRLSSPSDLRLPPETALLFAHLGGGARYRFAKKWSLELTCVPELMALASPRVLGLSDTGVALSASVGRQLQLGGGASVSAVVRMTGSAIPDRDQVWLSQSLGVALQGAWNW